MDESRESCPELHRASLVICLLDDQNCRFITLNKLVEKKKREIGLSGRQKNGRRESHEKQLEAQSDSPFLLRISNIAIRI